MLFEICISRKLYSEILSFWSHIPKFVYVQSSFKFLFSVSREQLNFKIYINKLINTWSLHLLKFDVCIIQSFIVFFVYFFIFEYSINLSTVDSAYYFKYAYVEN